MGDPEKVVARTFANAKQINADLKELYYNYINAINELDRLGSLQAMSAVDIKQYVERCKEAVDEMRIYERHEDGSLGNVKGKGNHDDRVITRAIGIHFCYKKMPRPKLTNKVESKGVTRKVVNDMTI